LSEADRIPDELAGVAAEVHAALSRPIVNRSMIRRFVDLFTRVRPLTCSQHYKLSPRELREIQDLREMIQELREEENETA
jgi:hypothetical protein